MNTYTTQDVAIAYMTGYVIAQESSISPANALYNYLRTAYNVPSMDAKKVAAFAGALVGAAFVDLGE